MFWLRGLALNLEAVQLDGSLSAADKMYNTTSGRNFRVLVRHARDLESVQGWN